MDNSEDIILKLNEISQKIDSLERQLDSLQELSRKGHPCPLTPPYLRVSYTAVRS